jgi:hypothetical protein
MADLLPRGLNWVEFWASYATRSQQLGCCCMPGILRCSRIALGIDRLGLIDPEFWEV